MQTIFEDYLFSQGYFVAKPEIEEERLSLQRAAESKLCSREQAIEALRGMEHALEAIVALVHFARIRITANPELASIEMLDVAKRNLGFDVPLPFYRGYPDSVRELGPFERLVDQLLHYFRTYGLGDFTEAGRSLLEEYGERDAFDEDVEPKEFAIITSDEAEAALARMAEGFLASTRPLNDADYNLLKTYLREYPSFTAEVIAGKDTVARLIIDMRNPQLGSFMKLSDVIRLVEWLLEIYYGGASIRKLNLKNRDRKLLSAILDLQFERGNVDTLTCLEKKRIWNGLLHHLHYKPKCAEAEAFCLAMRTKDQRSTYSMMEKRLAAGDMRGAVDVLCEHKGPGAVLRHLDYLFSYCDAENYDEDVSYVLDACKTNNKIMLVQLLLKYGGFAYYKEGNATRTFLFVRLGKLRVHRETEEESARRRAGSTREIGERMTVWLLEQLEKSCRGTLGKVYVDEGMRNSALPLQQGASMGGFGTLPRGTRIPIPGGKKIRAFTYWERVDDIDLSCIALADDDDAMEFSWRTNAWAEGLDFSGDQTSGYHGGSEYYDVNPSEFLEANGDCWHYLVFCDNVYSGEMEIDDEWVPCIFSNCICRAGYMLRDVVDSGEVFEPATVQTSFVINCSSRSAYLFALDLQDPAIIWLNLGENSMRNVAGEGDVSFLKGYLHTVDIINLRDFAQMLATEVVDDPAEADVVFSDEPPSALDLRDDQELIRSSDTARIFELLN